MKYITDIRSIFRRYDLHIEAFRQAMVTNHASCFARARAAALTCGELMLADSNLRFTTFEKESLLEYMRELEALPDYKKLLTLYS